MKPIDVESDSFAEYNEESTEKDPKFKVNDRVKISKYKNIYYLRVFVIKKKLKMQYLGFM